MKLNQEERSFFIFAYFAILEEFAGDLVHLVRDGKVDGRLRPLLHRFRESVQQSVQYPRERGRDGFPYTCAYQPWMETIDSHPRTFETSRQL